MKSSSTHAIRCELRLRRPKDVVAFSGQVTGLLGSETVDVSAVKEPVHRALANLPDDEAAILGFVRRWGRVRSGKEPVNTLRQSQQLLASPLEETTKALRAAHPEKNEDWDAPIVFSESQPGIIQLRDTLQKAWANDAQALESLQNAVKEQIGTNWVFKRGCFEITVQDAWAAACLLFLFDHAAGKIARCGNPKCPAPYFIKGRKNQVFCGDDECFAFGAYERTKTWWQEHGNEWRAERRKKTKKKAVKGDK
jgi:hypothetical protein